MVRLPTTLPWGSSNTSPELWLYNTSTMCHKSQGSLQHNVIQYTTLTTLITTWWWYHITCDLWTDYYYITVLVLLLLINISITRMDPNLAFIFQGFNRPYQFTYWSQLSPCWVINWPVLYWPLLHQHHYQHHYQYHCLHSSTVLHYDSGMRLITKYVHSFLWLRLLYTCTLSCLTVPSLHLYSLFVWLPFLNSVHSLTQCIPFCRTTILFINLCNLNVLSLSVFVGLVHWLDTTISCWHWQWHVGVFFRTRSDTTVQLFSQTSRLAKWRKGMKKYRASARPIYAGFYR